MAEQYPIVGVSAPEHWTGNYGPMVSYQVMLAGEAEPVGLNQKPETPAPQMGQNLFGDIWVDGAGRRKFKKAQPPQNGTQASLGGSSGQGKEEVDWEARNRLILEEASNNAAALVVAAAVQSGQLEFAKAIERHKEYSAILSSHAVVRSRYGTGEPEPAVEFNGAGATQETVGEAPAEYVPQPGQAVTEPAGASFTTAFDSASD